jgi:hypothetical protein
MIRLFGVGRRCEALATEATEGLREVHHQLIPGRAIAKTAGHGVIRIEPQCFREIENCAIRSPP